MLWALQDSISGEESMESSLPKLWHAHTILLLHAAALRITRQTRTRYDLEIQSNALIQVL